MPETLDGINIDEFVAKTFTSSSKRKGSAATADKVLIDLTAETISIPKREQVLEEDSIFHPNVSHSNNLCHFPITISIDFTVVR